MNKAKTFIAKHFNVHFVKDWIYSSLLILFLYDIIWLVIDYKEALEYLRYYKSFIFTDLLYSMVFAMVCLLITSYILRLNKLKPLKERHTMLLVLVFIFSNTALAFIAENTYDIFVDNSTDDEIFGNTYIMGIISSVVSLIYTINQLNSDRLKQKDEMIAMRTEQLKSRLSPHFVFNSLNVIISLIDDNDNEGATSFTIKLSRIYRHLINSFDKDYVSLDDALTVASEYMDVMKIRFPDIQLVIEPFSFSSNEMIVSMSLHNLIENAIKHNPADCQHPLLITISRNGDSLVVSNNIIMDGRNNHTKGESTRMGMANLHERHRLLGIDDVTVSIADGLYTVTLPIVTQQTNS